MGKPVFPILDWSGGVERPDLSLFINSKSWLIFDLLEFRGPQDWLLLSYNQWEIFSEYKQFKESSHLRAAFAAMWKLPSSAKQPAPAEAEL